MVHVVLDSSAFERNFGDLYRSLFSARAAFKSSFRKSEWQFLLTTTQFLDREREFNALTRAIGSVCDEKIIATEIETELGHSCSAEIPCDYESYLDVISSQDSWTLAVLRVAIFGRS